MKSLVQNLLVGTVFLIGILFSTRASPPPGQSCNLVLDDEFTNDAALNTKIWGYGTTPWGSEAQGTCCLVRSQDTYLTATGLVNTTEEGPFTGASGTVYDYGDGWIWLRPSQWRTYGYLEIEAQYPNETGAWPAFWMLQSGWPPEIDIAEYRGAPLGYMTEAFYNANSVWSTTTVRDAGNSFTGWHTYGLEWEPGVLNWYIDGVLKKSDTDPLVPSTPMYVILSGGADCSSANGTGFPNKFTIAYFRWYQVTATNLTLSPITVAPTGVFQGSGTPVTLSATVSGPGPIHFQWETDGGSGGTLTNIPNATNLTLTVQTIGLSSGVYDFALIATNSSSALTNSGQFGVLPPGAPSLIQGINSAYGWLTNGTILEAINLGPTSGSEGAGILAKPIIINGINFGIVPTLTSWNAGTWSWWPPAFPINMSDANQTNMYGKGMDIATWATSTAQITVPDSSLQRGHVYQLETMMSGSWSGAAINIYGAPDTNFNAQQYSYFGSAADQTNLTAYLYTWKDTTGGPAEVNMSDTSGTQEVFVWGYTLSDITSTVNLPIAISQPSVVDGQLEFKMNSTPDTVVNVQTSTNLMTWANSATVINFSGSDTYTNPGSTTDTRFFRLQRSY